MSKRILLLSSLYPSDDVKFLNNTSVCHYFAKEWVSMGFNVRVVYSYRIYPWYYYPILRILGKYIATKQPTAVLNKRMTKCHRYIMDGVVIDRIPIKKPRPHVDFKEKDISKHCKEIISHLKEDDFVPDIMLGHFVSPSLKILNKLRSVFPEAKTAVSMHGKGYDLGYNQEESKMISSLDYLGYRSHPIRKAYEERYGHHAFFMCPSGVPSDYIIENPRRFDKGIKRFIYVGSFMERKHPSTIVEALAKVMGSKDYTLVFVGDGVGKKNIIKKAKECGNLNRIHFTGRIPREKVTKEMDNADVFVMVSENETFGLVYLEAMARGCITIASRDEGMDGYIVDNVNGFLCQSGNSEELASVIKRIEEKPRMELERISSASIETAKTMTDKKVAEKYIKVFGD